MAGDLEPMLRIFRLREAVASVSLSHAENCDCKTCRAAGGDDVAFGQLLAEVTPALDAADKMREEKKTGEGQPGERYTCANCGGSFLRVTTDEEALEEWREVNPEASFEDEGDQQLVPVCETCWREIMENAEAAGHKVPSTFHEDDDA